MQDRKYYQAVLISKFLVKYSTVHFLAFTIQTSRIQSIKHQFKYTICDLRYAIYDLRFCQLSIINYQLSFVNCQLSIVNLPVSGPQECFAYGDKDVNAGPKILASSSDFKIPCSIFDSSFFSIYHPDIPHPVN